MNNKIGVGDTEHCGYNETKQAVITVAATEHMKLHRAQKSSLHKALSTQARSFKGHIIQF